MRTLRVVAPIAIALFLGFLLFISAPRKHLPLEIPTYAEKMPVGAKPAAPPDWKASFLTYDQFAERARWVQEEYERHSREPAVPPGEPLVFDGPIPGFADQGTVLRTEEKQGGGIAYLDMDGDGRAEVTVYCVGPSGRAPLPPGITAGARAEVKSRELGARMDGAKLLLNVQVGEAGIGTMRLESAD